MKKRIITDEMLNAFKAMLKEGEKSGHTIEKYMRDVCYFQKFTKDRPIEKITTIEYKTHLEKVYALSSANSMIASLNSFFRFVGWEDCCVKQFKVQRKAFCAEDSELTKAEYISLVRAAEQTKNERLSLLIQTICGTGVRVSEVSFITVEAAKQGKAVVFCKDKIRTIFIVSALRTKLLRYAKEKGIFTGMIFVTKSGKPLNRSNIWKEMKDICKQAGVPRKKVFPHNLRHLFARTFYGIEKDIVKLADILGHSNINTTRIYIISTGAEHRRKMEMMKLII